MNAIWQYIVVLAYVTLIIGVVSGCLAIGAYLLSKLFPPDEGNRPAPPEVLARREAARADAWRRVAERAKD